MPVAKLGWRHLAIAVLSTMAVAGCESIDALTFRKDPNSGVPGRAETTAYLVGTSLDHEVPSLPLYPGLREALEGCGVVSKPGPTAIGAAIIGLGIDLAIKAGSEALQARIDEMKAASVKSYSSTIIFDDAATFGIGPADGRKQCLLLLRTLYDPDRPDDPKNFKIGMAMVVQLVPRGTKARNAIILAPTYAYVENAAAITRAGQPIDLNVAVSVVATLDRKEGPGRQEMSLGTFDIRDVALGKPWVQPDRKMGPNSGLMVLPPKDATALEVKMVVVETGSALPDTEKAKAQIKALQDAVGPEIKAGILKGLSLE